MKRGLRCGLGVWLALLGGDVVASKPLSLSAVVEQQLPDGRARVVEPSEVLCSEESFVVRVEVSQPAFVYIAIGQATGSVDVLYPVEGSPPAKLQPGHFYRMPAPRESTFRLAPPSGDEHIMAVASARALQHSEVRELSKKALATVFGAIQPLRPRSCPQVPVKPPANLHLAPDGSDERYRNVVLRQKQVRLWVGDVVIVRIPIAHR